jgi:hypothetical protein
MCLQHMVQLACTQWLLALLNMIDVNGLWRTILPTDTINTLSLLSNFKRLQDNVSQLLSCLVDYGQLSFV